MNSYRELMLILSVCLNLMFALSATIFAASGWVLKDFADLGTGVGGTLGAVVGSLTVFYVYQTFREQRSSATYTAFVKDLEQIEKGFVALKPERRYSYHTVGPTLHNMPNWIETIKGGEYGPEVFFLGECLDEYEKFARIISLIINSEKILTNQHSTDLKSKATRIKDLYLVPILGFFGDAIHSFDLHPPEKVKSPGFTRNDILAILKLLNLTLRFQDLSVSLVTYNLVEVSKYENDGKGSNKFVVPTTEDKYDARYAVLKSVTLK